MLGRPVVMAIAANLPTTRVDFDRLLLYCIRLLDPIVVSEYVLVLVNTPIPSERRPTFSWMKRAYGIFNRKYVLHWTALRDVGTCVFDDCAANFGCGFLGCTTLSLHENVVQIIARVVE